MNTRLVTTGLAPLNIGSTEIFQVAPLLNGAPWNLAGGSATLTLSDPNGNKTTLAGSIVGTGYGATSGWTVVGPVGTWTRSWTLSDASGIVQVTDPIVFVVQSSPS
jgi:hypothetical protein